jgi:protein-tyrosine phosphatase
VVPEVELDVNWVTPQLAVGGRFPMSAASGLVERQIRFVVDVRLEDWDDRAVLEKEGISFLHLPTPDRQSIPPELIDQGVGWVISRLPQPGRTLIHCEYGIGRSPLLTCCILVSLGSSPLDALRSVKSARFQVSPSPAQLGALLDWASQWRQKNDVYWDLPSVDELSRIAYSHLVP